MFKLIRRISSSVFPRPDRPWSDDATSTAPTIGRKRRISSTEMDTGDDPILSLSKRPRAGRQLAKEDEDRSATEQSSPPPSEPSPPEGVKEVTKGVKTIDLDSKVVATVSAPDASPATLPASPDPNGIPILDTQSTKAVGEDATGEVLQRESPTEASSDEVVEETEEGAAKIVPRESAETRSEVEVVSLEQDDAANAVNSESRVKSPSEVRPVGKDVDFADGLESEDKANEG